MPHALRSASHSLSALWITDDVLADAFHRFLRVSRAHRRYACNKPGPLEARRRHVNRRMALAATAASPSGRPGMVDIAALFGIGAKPPQDPEKSMRWEQPSPRPSFGDIGLGPPPSPPVQQRNVWPLNSSGLRTRRHAVIPLDEVALAIQTSKAAFKALLHSLDHDQVPESTMQQVVDFLQSSRDELGADNVRKLVRWLQGRQCSPDALLLFARSVQEKALLRTIKPTQLEAPLLYLLQQNRFAPVKEPILSILNTLSQHDCYTVATQISRLLKDHYHRTEDHSTDTVGYRKREWRLFLDVLDECKHTRHLSRAEHSFWHSIHQQCALCFRPPIIAEHLGRLDDEALAHVLLRHWRPTEHPATPGDDYDICSIKDHILLSRFNRAAEQKKLPSAEVLIEEYSRLRQATSINDTGHKGPHFEFAWSALADAFTVLAGYRADYPQLLTDVVNVYQANGASAKLFSFLHTLKQNSKVAIPTQAAENAICHLLSTTERVNVLRASIIFALMPNLSVVRHHELPIRLVQENLGKPSRIFRLLQRQVVNDFVFASKRSKHKLTLTHAHITLCHLVAHAYAMQDNMRTRVRFRRVWEIYRFLQDRGAPLHPLLSRAVVNAGILRYLATGRHLPGLQISYIVSLVRRIDGDDVAASLERLIIEAKRTVGKSGTDPATGWRFPPATPADTATTVALAWRMKMWMKGYSRWYTRRTQAADKR